MTRRRRDSGATPAGSETLSDFSGRAATVHAQEVGADQQRIALNQDEAIRFLDVLETVDRETIRRLRVLRKRA